MRYPDRDGRVSAHNDRDYHGNRPDSWRNAGGGGNGSGGGQCPVGSAARKLDQSAARKVIHLKAVHSTSVLSGLFLVRGGAV